MPPRFLTAGWVLPMDGPPIRNGAVLIGGDGRIEAVGPAGSVPCPADAERSGWPDAAILPGLVNTHTHLELTGFAGMADEDEFADWIRRIRALKAERSADEFLAAARQGLADCHAAGVTTVADTGDSGAVIQALAEAGGSGIAYHEVFGPHPDQLDESMAGLRQRVSDLRRFASERVRLGVSPHAPYTVSAELYRAVADFAEQERLPVAVHLAESAAESELVTGGAGPFAEAWRLRGIPLPAAGGASPVAWLERHGVLGERTLAIHVVRAGGDDVALLRRSRTAVAHCPLSNRRHGHGAAPLAAFLEAGLAVGVGTDSVASVGRLDLLAEAQAARALAGLSAMEALALVTSGAARAIGMADEVGALRPGSWGDLAVVNIGQAGSAEPALEAVLASTPAEVAETILGGRTVYRG
ncbi:MAG TPA: amidohydrolase family protein [Gemmatimonadales bacterium]|nr:amidohydrolase family protein [Gemmatimonadales bacterium]